MTRLLAPALLLLVSCAPVDPGPDPEACTKQSDCSTEYKRACVAQKCGTTFPDTRTVAVNAYRADIVRQLKGFRAFVLHPTTPAGGTVHCDTSTGKIGGRAEFTGDSSSTAAIAAYNGELSDPAKFNSTAYPTTSANVPSGDTVAIPVLLDESGRAIYIEFYERAPSQAVPGGEGLPIGSLCLENVQRIDPPGGGVQQLGGTVREW